MRKTNRKPEDILELTIEFTECESIAQLNKLIGPYALEHFRWSRAEVVLEHGTEVKPDVKTKKTIQFDLLDGNRPVGALLFEPIDNNPPNFMELDLFTTGIITFVSKLRLAQCCAEQTEELEHCRNRIDSIVSDLNAIEQIKANFISIASHELRTPLTVTRGYVEILLEDDQLSAAQKETLNGVYKGVLKQAEILDSLFEMAKFDTLSPVLNQERVSIGKLTRDVVKKLAKPMQDRGIVIDINSGASTTISVDSQSIRTLLLNLIQNAIKFTPDNAKVVIDIKATKMTNNNGIVEPGVLISIRDTGVGIDSEQLELIFTRFYQLKEKLDTHSSGKTKFKGSGMGLGLALSKAITLAHNGKIWAESAGYDEEKMPGSVFHVFLPAKK